MPTHQTSQNAKASAKSAASAAENAAEAFAFGIKSTDIPVAFREFADRSLDQAKEFYAQVRSTAEEANELVEGTFETSRKHAMALGLQALDAVKTNTDASFALFKDLLGAKTFADAVELQTAFARKQWDAATEQFKELQDATQKAILESAGPTREAFERAFRTVTKAA